MNLKYKIFSLLILFIIISCNGNDNSQQEITVEENTEENNDQALDVSKEDGGPGFESIAETEGWESNSNYAGYGTEESIRGGDFLSYTKNEPGTYRSIGINSHNTAAGMINDYAYQGLLSLDTLTNEYFPSIASHWKNEIVDGKQIAHFRIDPRARWWDGTEITTDDIIATYNLRADEGIQDPYVIESAGFYEIEKISKYIIKVTIQDVDWKKFWSFGSSGIYPASHLSKIDGATFLEKYNRNQLMGSGPYQLDEQETEEGQKYVLRKVENWWGHGAHPYTKNMYNFDRIIYEVVTDENIIKENFILGKYYTYSVNQPSEWYDQFGLEVENVLPALANNVMKKRILFDHRAKGRTYLGFNLLKPILDDKRFRQAVYHLWNRDQVIEKIYLNDSVKQTSFWPLSRYKSPNLVEYDYNPEKAAKILDEMGYTERDENGIRMNAEGVKLEFNAIMRNYGTWPQMNTLLQSDLKDGGIQMNMNVVDFAEWVRVVESRQYDLSFIGYTESTYPDPRGSLHSSVAETPGSSNDTAISDPRIDKLIEQYELETDLNKQPGYLQQIDQIINDEVYLAFAWVAPYSSRYIYWDIFAYPPTLGGSLDYWWIDPDKKSQVDKFLGGDTTVTMETEPLIFDYYNLKPSDFVAKG